MTPVPASTVVSHGRPEPAPLHLRGRRLLLARAAWLVLALLTLAFVMTGLTASFAGLKTVCSTNVCRTGALTVANLQELELLGFSADFFATYVGALVLAFALTSIAAGAIVVWRKSDDGMALFVASVLVTFASVGFLISLGRAAAMSLAGHWPWNVVLFMGNISPVLLFLVFPDGRFVPRWTRWLGVAVLLIGIIFHFFPASPPSRWVSSPLAAVVSLSIVGGAVASQIYRYRHVSTTVERQQTKWVVWGIALAMVGVQSIQLGLPLLNHPHVLVVMLAYTLLYLSMSLIPLSIGVAVLRYRLWDVDPLINRTLVYTGLTAGVAGTYVLVVGSLSLLFQTRGNLLISLLATGLVAVLFQPLRERLQRAVNHLLYGERDEPYVVLARLGQRLEAATTPDALLPAIVETVRETLKLPYVAIAVDADGSSATAASGEPVADTLDLPLAYHGERIGMLALGPRAPGEPFTSADRRLLDDLARQAGIAAHAVRLTAALQHSRERLVLAREEDRRRLRNDLHDGLAPTLAMLALNAGDVVDTIPSDPSAAAALAARLEHNIRNTVQEVRRIVYGLRPPALDELGLVAAIRECARQDSRPKADGQTTRLQVRIEAPDHLPALPAAVEVAAYRITQEALMNVVRHAGARTCTVRLSLADVLTIEILDDGIGLPREHRAGVGLESLHERAAELGGSCLVEALPDGGTRVVAWLPVATL